MFKVGLTGGIASGKSTVSTMFRDKGFKILDADIIAREVLTLYPELIEKIKINFGEHFINLSGNLKRQELGEYIFKYPTERIKLDKIMIPVIIKEIFKRLNDYENDGLKLCILDAPTLIEHGIHEEMDMNMLVWVDKSTQLNRLKKRDDLENQQAISRLNAQMNLEDKKKHVNFIIDNSKSIESTKQQVEEIIEVLKMYL